MQGTLKDKITNICAIVIAIGGGIVSAHASGQVILPDWIVAVAGGLVAVATAIIGIFTGKDSDGKAKTDQ